MLIKKIVYTKVQKVEMKLCKCGLKREYYNKLLEISTW